MPLVLVLKRYELIKDRQTNEHRDERTNRQVNEQIDGQTDRRVDGGKTGGLAGEQLDWQSGMQA
jgi:hypothetical protein